VREELADRAIADGVLEGDRALFDGDERGVRGEQLGHRCQRERAVVALGTEHVGCRRDAGAGARRTPVVDDGER
jgi:hypothetical protein